MALAKTWVTEPSGCHKIIAIEVEHDLAGVDQPATLAHIVGHGIAGYLGEQLT